jgi:hypothetical protein
VKFLNQKLIILMQEIIRDNAITIAATNSAFFSILVGYPFDSIKTKMQAQKYQSTFHCIKTTYQTQSIPGFYRGVLPLLATSTSLRAVSWNVYTKSKQMISHDNISLNAFMAGSYTGSFMSIFGAPIEFIKVQRQLNIGTKKNAIDWVRFIVKQKGLKGLYSGYQFHAPVEILGTGFYFMVYETFKHNAFHYTDKINASNTEAGAIGTDATTYTFGKPLGINQAWIPLVGGGLAGSLSWILVFPLDVIKSMVQKEAFTNTSVKDLVLMRFKEFGLGGFYRGLSMQLIRSFPVHSLNFYVYENVWAWCNAYK